METHKLSAFSKNVQNVILKCKETKNSDYITLNSKVYGKVITHLVFYSEQYKAVIMECMLYHYMFMIVDDLKVFQTEERA